MQSHRLLSAVIGGVLILAAANAQSQTVPLNLPAIGAGMSGNWFNPDQSGHGVQIEVLDGGRAVVVWYTYALDGSPLWLFGTGRVNSDRIEADLLAFSGGRPPAHWADGEVQGDPWGSVTLTFENCDQGLLSWDSSNADFASGELALTRLTNLQGLRCQGDELFGLQLGFSFERGQQGFEAVFADLPADYDPEIYELDFAREELPAPLNAHTGLRLTGHNRSDDLAMLVTRAVHGLEPDTEYRIEIDADFASDVPQGCAGVGGSPGEGLYLKLGAAGIKPQAVVDDSDNWLRLNVDYGVQSGEGENTLVVGNLANSQDCDDGTESDWELKTVSTRGRELTATSNADGVIWVYAGSDSAFEGLTSYYITALRVRLDPLEPDLD